MNMMGKSPSRKIQTNDRSVRGASRTPAALSRRPGIGAEQTPALMPPSEVGELSAAINSS